MVFGRFSRASFLSHHQTSLNHSFTSISSQEISLHTPQTGHSPRARPSGEPQHKITDTKPITDTKLYRYRVRTYHTCSELQYPTPRHPSSPSGLSPTASRQERPSGIALLCSTVAHGSGLLCGLDHFMDSIDVAARRCLRPFERRCGIQLYRGLEGRWGSRVARAACYSTLYTTTTDTHRTTDETPLIIIMVFQKYISHIPITVPLL